MNYDDLPTIGTASSSAPSSYDDLPTVSFGSEANAVKNDAIRGVGNLADFAQGINVFDQNPDSPTYANRIAHWLTGNKNPLGPTVSDQLLPLAEKAGIYDKTEPVTPLGTILGETAKAAPFGVLGGPASALLSGAGIGGAKVSGFGPVGQFIAGLGAGSIPSIAEHLGQRTAQAAEALPEISLPDFSPETKAAQIMTEAANDPNAAAKLSEALTNPSEFQKYQTPAELIQNPGLAKLQTGLVRNEDAGATFGQVLQDRANARGASLESLASSTARELPVDEAGAALRSGIIQPLEKQARKDVNTNFELLKSIGEPNIPIRGVEKTAARNIGQIYPKIGTRTLPEETPQTVDDTVAYLQKIQAEKELPESMRAGKPDSKLASLINTIKNADDMQPLSVMQALRSEADNIREQAIRTGDRQTARIANQIKGAFNNAEATASGAGGDMLPIQKALLDMGRKQRAVLGTQFEEGASKRILKDTGYGRFNLPDEKVVSAYLGSPSGTKQLLSIVGNNPQAKDLVLGQFVKDIRDLSPAMQAREITRKGRVLDLLLENDPEHLAAIKGVAEDIASENSVGSLAAKAHMGGSSTAPNLSVAKFIKNRLGIVGNILDAVGSKVIAKREEQVNQLLLDAMWDRPLALKLLTKGGPKATETAAAEVVAETLAKRDPSVIDKIAKVAPAIAATVFGIDKNKENKNGTSPLSGVSDFFVPPAEAATIAPAAGPSVFNKENSKKSSGFQPISYQGSDMSKTIIPDYISPQMPTQQAHMGLLLDAVKRVESNGNTNAVSPAGAKGAYQFTDATAKDYGLTDPFNEPKARNAAQQKIMDDLHHFGDIELALAAYNAGRGRVDKLLKQTGGKSYDDIEKLLPPETQKYLPKIEKVFSKLLKTIEV